MTVTTRNMVDLKDDFLTKIDEWNGMNGTTLRAKFN